MAAPKRKHAFKKSQLLIEIRFFGGALSQKLRQSSISFVMSVRLSVRTDHLGSHWTDFHEI
jgi:hypothetical protein